jgi:hypothetical protein
MKDRMRQFMSAEDMHVCLSQIIAQSREKETSSLVEQRLHNGMTFADFCTGCITARWSGK